MENQIINIAEPNITDCERARVAAAMAATYLSGISPIVREFEIAFAKKTGRAYAVSCNSGTSALMLAMAALKPKSLVLPAFGYIALPNACAVLGIPFSLRDVDAQGNILQHKPEHDGKEVLAVHTYGHVYQGECLIEDAAEAIGLQTNRSRITCFSFFANKTMTTGEGGMCTTDDLGLYKTMLGLRDHWNTRHGLKRYYSKAVGYSLAMGGLQAALGLAQLERLDEFLKIKQRIVRHYDHMLFNGSVAGDFAEDTPQRIKAVRFGGSWMYGILLRNQKTRDDLMQFLADHGIESRNFFPAIYRQRAFYKKHGGVRAFPKADYLANHGLYLPSGTTLLTSHQQRVSDIIHKFFKP